MNAAIPVLCCFIIYSEKSGLTVTSSLKTKSVWYFMSWSLLTALWFSGPTGIVKSYSSRSDHLWGRGLILCPPQAAAVQYYMLSVHTSSIVAPILLTKLLFAGAVLGYIKHKLTIAKLLLWWCVHYAGQVWQILGLLTELFSAVHKYQC